MNMIEILKETIEYYGQDPEEKRGLKISTHQVTGQPISICQYVVTNGETKFCAVGRCLTDEGKAFAQEQCVGGAIEDLTREYWKYEYSDGFSDHWSDQDEDFTDTDLLNELLKPEYRGFSAHFWQNLQSFHDSYQNWSTDRTRWLTDTGYKNLLDILDQMTVIGGAQQEILNFVEGRVES